MQKKGVGMGYTEFGKFVKKLIIDNDENLGTIATLFNVSTAFVSAVFTGNKSVPDDWYSTLCEHYNLDENSRNLLYDAFCNTKQSIKLNLTNVEIDKKKLAIQFQRKLSSLSDEELDSIFKILNEEVH